jgi:hypothetical protein
MQVIFSGISIAVTPTNICEGQTATITANYVNGGPAPTFNFVVNGVTQQYGAANYYLTSSLHYTDSVVCIISNSAACPLPDSLASNIIHPPVWPNADPVITIYFQPW